MEGLFLLYIRLSFENNEDLPTVLFLCDRAIIIVICNEGEDCLFSLLHADYNLIFSISSEKTFNLLSLQ